MPGSRDVFDLLASLTDRSLVVSDTEEGRGRSRLLETVRQYSLELLHSQGESEALRNRHLAYFAEFASAASQEVLGANQVEWLERLESEHENLRASLEWGLSGEGSESALRICTALLHFWHRQGHITEARQWCDRALRSKVGREPSAARAGVLNTAGMLAWMQGDYAASQAFYEESLEIAQTLARGIELSWALYGLGLGAFGRDEYREARTRCEEAHAIAKELGDRYLIGQTGYFAGIVLRIEGDYEGALRAYRATITVMREMGDRMGLSYPLYDIGLAEYYQGKLESAEKYHEESLGIRRSTKERWGIAESEYGMGLVAHAKGDFPRARACFDESLAIAQELGDESRAAICLHWLGCISLAEGDLPQAVTQFQRCLDLNQALGDRWSTAHSFAGCAALAAHHGDFESAMSLWAAEEALRTEIASPLPPVQRAQRDAELGAARKSMANQAAADLAWQKGLSLGMEKAIEAAADVLTKVSIEP